MNKKVLSKQINIKTYNQKNKFSGKNYLKKCYIFYKDPRKLKFLKITSILQETVS